MKDHLIYYIKHSRIINISITSLIILILFSGCGRELENNSIFINSEDYSSYSKVVEKILPSYNIIKSENKPYYILNDGNAAEAFDTQAIGALETGIAEYWYPHYLATVIIAVDRDQTDAEISHWKDLLAIKEDIGFFYSPGNIQMVTSAMSYGLEGEKYSLTRAKEMLASLHEDKRLKINSFTSPVIICYDYQAVNLIEKGRNLEIIIPKEGTYTYIKGLLSKEELNFKSLYPSEGKYIFAARVGDYKHFAQVSQKVTSVFERDVLNSKKFMSIDNREHLNLALIYIIFVTIWVASVLRRSLQKGISYAAFFTGVILNSWTLVRLIKYQLEPFTLLNRYLWYSFYIFQLSLPLVILWMAWAIDKQDRETLPPKWWQKMAILIGFLILFVFTNDIHGFVFNLDLSKTDWSTNYTYGFGYYIILFVCMMNIFAAFVLLFKKSIRNPRRKRFLFPLIIFILFGIYNYKYIVRDPFIYKTDLTIITGIFTMLMLESCIRTGLIPVNTKYIQLFKASPLKMQIIDNNRRVVLASAVAEEFSIDILYKTIASSPVPVLQEDESLLFAKPIPGGYALWNEDVSKIQELQREIQKTSEKLTNANLMLAEEEKIKRRINEKNAKKQLMDQLETEIAEYIKKLSTMIEELPNSENSSMESVRIALLLCYIKRRCSLFFQEKEYKRMDGQELTAYIEELSELAKYSNVQIATVNHLKKNIPIRYAILFYDFSYILADIAIRRDFSSNIQYLGIKDDLISMSFLTSNDLQEQKLESRFIKAIRRENGQIIIKKIEDNMSISISFPKGGSTND